MSTVKRKCRVVMLPTEKVSHIYINRVSNALQYKYALYTNPGQGQHLYILSDDEIKKGDWVLGGTNTIVQCMYPENVVDRDVKKIIATTDVLGVVDDELSKSMGGKVERRLPQPSKGFIQKYIEAYNNRKPIEEVTVDYESAFNVIQVGGPGFPEDDIYQIIPQPKVSPKDNTITISKVKDSWTRGEVEALLTKLYYEDLPLVGGRFEEWIEDNLK